MLDLFAGRGGSSAAMVERGWTVHRVELEPGLLETPLPPAAVVDHRADVRLFDYTGPPLDLVWASPPCTEFSRLSMPWHPCGGAPPDMRLLFAALGQIATLRPRWWAIENVKGAIPWWTPWLGPPVASGLPIFLWGRLPPLVLPRGLRHKAGSGDRPDLRSHIPWSVSAAVADAIELAEGRRAA
jgi:hypothetical protein